MLKKVATAPDLTRNSPSHLSAIAKGKEHFYSYQYNVAPHFKGKNQEQIKQALANTAFPVAVCFEAWMADYNIASGIRNANAFNAIEVFYLGLKKIDRRGTVGTHNYTKVNFLPTLSDFISLKSKYKIIGIDNIPGAKALSSYNWERTPTLLVFGSEGLGLTPEIQSHCEETVYIEQFGSVPSLNCATASGIVLYEFTKQFKK